MEQPAAFRRPGPPPAPFGATHCYLQRLRHRNCFKARNGFSRWFLGQALPRRAEDGEIIAWSGTCTDIQEQRQMREHLQAAYSDLEVKVMFRMLDLEREVKE